MSDVELNFLPHVSMSHLQRKFVGILARKAPAVVPHKELLALWPDRSNGALNMMLYGLRRKLRPQGYDVISHRGLGYSLHKPENETGPEKAARQKLSISSGTKKAGQ